MAISRWLPAAVLTAAVLFGGTVPASGAAQAGLPGPRADGTATILPVTTPIATARQWLSAALTARSNALTSLASLVQNSKSLTSVDRSAMTAIVTSATSGIASLTSKVPDDSTISQVQADATAMVVNFEVFAVIKPQVNAVKSVDDFLGPLQQHATSQSGLRTAIAADQIAGKNVARVLRIDGDLASLLSDASGRIASMTVLLDRLVAASYPTSIQTFAKVSRNVQTIGEDLATATNDENRIVAGLASLGAVQAKKARSKTG